MVECWTAFLDGVLVVLAVGVWIWAVYVSLVVQYDDTLQEQKEWQKQFLHELQELRKDVMKRK